MEQKADEKQNNGKGKERLRSYEYLSVKNGKEEWIKLEGKSGFWQTIPGFFYTKVCLFCSKQFESTRVDKAFCSDKCQHTSASHRRKGLRPLQQR